MQDLLMLWMEEAGPHECINTGRQMIRELSNDYQNVCSSAAGWVWTELLKQGRQWHSPGCQDPVRSQSLGSAYEEGMMHSTGLIGGCFLHLLFDRKTSGLK